LDEKDDLNNLVGLCLLVVVDNKLTFVIDFSKYNYSPISSP